MASWANGRTLRAFGVIAVNECVVSTIELSIFTGPGACRVSVRQSEGTLLKWCG